MRVIVSSELEPFVCEGKVAKRRRISNDNDNGNFVAEFTADKKAFHRAKHATVYTAHVAQVVERGGGIVEEELCRMQFLRDGKGGKRCKTA